MYAQEWDCWIIWQLSLGSPCGSAGKESTCNVGDLSMIPGLGRSPGEEKDYTLQYPGLENCMDYIVLGVTKSWTWLSNFQKIKKIGICALKRIRVKFVSFTCLKIVFTLMSKKEKTKLMIWISRNKVKNSFTIAN